jgi:hypothetical protein
MAETQSKIEGNVEQAADRIRELNERIIEASKQAGEVTLGAHTTMLENFAGLPSISTSRLNGRAPAQPSPGAACATVSTRSRQAAHSQRPAVASAPSISCATSIRHISRLDSDGSR